MAIAVARRGRRPGAAVADSSAAQTSPAASQKFRE
jgi:hypothetical protein